MKIQPRLSVVSTPRLELKIMINQLKLKKMIDKEFEEELKREKYQDDDDDRIRQENEAYENNEKEYWEDSSAYFDY